ncbi:MAG: hypothetical protein LBQ55_04640 [Treponema sp.]|jgi:hypothetical protein|nr:hypothetical protein [Treponema sp.]
MTLAIIFSAASLILCGFFFVYFRAWLGSRMGKDEKLARYREEVNQLIAAIDMATDRDAAIAEDRIQTLKNLIVKADERIAVLLREPEGRKNHQSSDAAVSYAAIGRSHIRIEPAAPETAEPALVHEAASSESPVSAPTAGTRERRPETAPPETPPAPRPFAEEVAELAAQGLSAELIAQKLEVSLSEVDLAMNIRGSRYSGGRFS